jgi:hypothetical protein
VNGYTFLHQGTLMIGGKFEQGGPTSPSFAQTVLEANTTLAMTNGIVQINNGQVLGTGSISCNELVMGHHPDDDPNTPTP